MASASRSPVPSPDACATVAITGRARTASRGAGGRPAECTAAIPADVSDGAQVAGLVEQVLARFGQLDVVVSNAAD